jgi:hypothetical protein
MEGSGSPRLGRLEELTDRPSTHRRPISAVARLVNRPAM